MISHIRPMYSHFSKYLTCFRKTSWKEAQQFCAARQQRLVQPHDLTEELSFFEQAFLNIQNGKGVDMGDITFIGVSNEALVSRISFHLL